MKLVQEKAVKSIFTGQIDFAEPISLQGAPPLIKSRDPYNLEYFKSIESVVSMDLNGLISLQGATPSRQI